ncbi:MAG: histidine kinase [Frankiales bacterium]|nr:histidine kinase [Frankiales bacterium]
MNHATRIGDGLALGDNLAVAADQAVSMALSPLRGARPDLAFVFVSGGTPAQTQEALEHARAAIGARTTLGCGAHGVIAAGRGIEGVRGVSVWVASLPNVTVRAFHLEVLRTSDHLAVLGLPSRQHDDVVGVLLADPHSFPVGGFVEHSRESLGGLPLVGALASGTSTAGETRVLLDGRVFDRGAVGVVLGGDLSVHTLVSQGCRPIGLPMAVTGVDGERLLSLAGRSALDQAKAAIATLPPAEQPQALRGLHLGVAVDEYADEHLAADFVVRTIVGAEQVDGSITIGERLAVGTTVQFLLRDAHAAHDDLAEVLAGLRSRMGLGALAGALLFSADSRGRSLFPTPDHDVAAVRAALDVGPVAGFFASGEIGPVGGRNHVHGSTASLLAFGS